MDNIRCVIKAIRDPLEKVNEDWSKVTGKETMPNSVYYKHTETGQAFSYLTGGIGWPSKIKENKSPQPGCAVVVGVERTESPYPKYFVLEAVEDDNVEELLRKCWNLRFKYGFLESDEAMRIWYGDPESYGTIVQGCNEKLARRHDYSSENWLFIYGPWDWENSNKNESYVRRVRDLLEGTAENEEKRLFLGSCDNLRNRLRSFQPDSPAVLALGYVLFSLEAWNPWNAPVSREAVNLPDWY
jgi:hypothetical protein